MTNWIDELSAAAEKATPGPWKAVTYDGPNRVVTREESALVCADCDCIDTEFIALANPATILRLCQIARIAKEHDENPSAEGFMKLRGVLKEALRDEKV